MPSPAHLPLSALLSQALVAFTIEFDNEFEHRVPHRTTNYGSTADSRSAPWLVSMVMWLMLLRFVPLEGITVGELRERAGLRPKELQIWLTRTSKWWSYVSVETGTTRSASACIVRFTPAGRQAWETWRALTPLIENRWQERFGEDNICRLRESLRSLADRFPGLPDHLPILGYDLLSRATERGRTIVPEYTLPILLSKALLAFAMEFERDSGLSLAMVANVFRFVNHEGIRVRDIPRLSGISKEGIAIATDRLEKRGLISVKTESASSRTKILVLTPAGRDVQRTCLELLFKIEKCWQNDVGRETISALRSVLERLAGDQSPETSPLFRGLRPYENGWRASVPPREALPHYPMILHRGGFPDGS